jgi:hypothetical protein
VIIYDKETLEETKNLVDMAVKWINRNNQINFKLLMPSKEVIFFK